MREAAASSFEAEIVWAYRTYDIHVCTVIPLIPIRKLLRAEKRRDVRAFVRLGDDSIQLYSVEIEIEAWLLCCSACLVLWHLIFIPSAPASVEVIHHDSQNVAHSTHWCCKGEPSWTLISDSWQLRSLRIYHYASLIDNVITPWCTTICRGKALYISSNWHVSVETSQ